MADAATFAQDDAPVGIRTRALGSTDRDHRPLDHRGAPRDTGRSILRLAWHDERWHYESPTT